MKQKEEYTSSKIESRKIVEQRRIRRKQKREEVRRKSYEHAKE